MTRKKIFKFTIAIIPMLLACGSEGPASNEDGAQPATRFVVVQRESGRQGASIVWKEDKIRINRAPGESALVGKWLEGGGRRYQSGEGGTVLEVEAKDDGFFVSNPEGFMRWSVQRDELKINVIEEGSTNAYLLRIRGPSRVKVVEGKQDLGRVKHYPNKDEVQVNDMEDRGLFKIQGSSMSAGFGVLLMEKIPEEERLVILAEILDRGW